VRWWLPTIKLDFLAMLLTFLFQIGNLVKGIYMITMMAWLPRLSWSCFMQTAARNTYQMDCKITHRTTTKHETVVQLNCCLINWLHQLLIMYEWITSTLKCLVIFFQKKHATDKHKDGREISWNHKLSQSKVVEPTAHRPHVAYYTN